MKVSDLLNNLGNETLVQIQVRLCFGEVFYCDRISEELKRNPIIMRRKVEYFCISKNVLIIKIEDEDEDIASKEGGEENQDDSMEIKLIHYLRGVDKDKLVRLVCEFDDVLKFKTYIETSKDMFKAVKRRLYCQKRL